MDVKSFINQHIVFRFGEILLAVGGQQGPSVATVNKVRTLLHYYCKKGKLVNVRKGLYAVPSERAYESNMIDPLLIAGKATDDAVIAYHSALESHNIAYTDFNEHTYISKHRTNDFTFQAQHYRSIYDKTLDWDKVQSGIEAIIIMGTRIRRTTLARTIVDVLDRPKISGGWEEVMQSLDRITKFDTASAVEYALSLNRASIIAKLGYYLDGLPKYFSLDPSILNRLLKKIPKQPYYIERDAIGKSILINKWNIMVPKYLHERQWEEPDELEE